MHGSRATVRLRQLRWPCTPHGHVRVCELRAMTRLVSVAQRAMVDVITTTTTTTDDGERPGCPPSALAMRTDWRGFLCVWGTLWLQRLRWTDCRAACRRPEDVETRDPGEGRALHSCETSRFARRCCSLDKGSSVIECDRV
jgi:hypothetical protein